MKKWMTKNTPQTVKCLNYNLGSVLPLPQWVSQTLQDGHPSGEEEAWCGAQRSQDLIILAQQA